MSTPAAVTLGVALLLIFLVWLDTRRINRRRDSGPLNEVDGHLARTARELRRRERRVP
jgi:hypothetical protein